MLLESLVKATMELQEFRVMAVTGDAGGLVAELVPDLRFSPPLWPVRGAGPVPGHAGNTALSARVTVGDRGGAPLCATARTVCLGALASMSNRCRGSAANSR